MQTFREVHRSIFRSCIYFSHTLWNMFLWMKHATIMKACWFYIACSKIFWTRYLLFFFCEPRCRTNSLNVPGVESVAGTQAHLTAILFYNENVFSDFMLSFGLKEKQNVSKVNIFLAVKNRCAIDFKWNIWYTSISKCCRRKLWEICQNQKFNILDQAKNCEKFDWNWHQVNFLSFDT